MKAVAEPPANRASTGASIDFERREDRFLILARDAPELKRALAAVAREVRYPATPVTRTVYFGDTTRGLPRGLSVKARTYGAERLFGRWDLEDASLFHLLELKRTVAAKHRGAAGAPGRHGRQDRGVEILRLSGSLFDRAALKEKKRKPSLSLAGLRALLADPRAARAKIEPELYAYLLESVYPLRGFGWSPLIGTEYERTHFVAADPEQADALRATLDRRVAHYAFEERGGAFEGVPVGSEEFLRLEIKADPARLAETSLGEQLDRLLSEFGAFRVASKKYRGLTLRSVYLLRREGLRDEAPGRRIYGSIRSRPVKYRDQEHYVHLARYLQGSEEFRLYHAEPVLLERHEHHVSGRLKGLDVTISGSELEVHRRAERLTDGRVKVYRADRMPVTSVPLSAREDLAGAGAEEMKKRKARYVRFRGFLVQHVESGRVYLVGLERRIGASAGPRRYRLLVEYAGRARGRPMFGDREVIEEIERLGRFLGRDPLLGPGGADLVRKC